MVVASKPEGCSQLERDARAAEAIPASAAAHRASVRHVANPTPEEPDAGNLHVRIRGGPGGSTAGAPPPDLARACRLMGEGAYDRLHAVTLPRPARRPRLEDALVLSADP